MSERHQGELGEQLCSLVDNELGDAQSRFLLKRLDHDQDLKDRWQRYHLVRSVLQDRQFTSAGDLSARVADAVADESMETAAGADRLRRWLQPLAGAAVAASVALVAFNVWQSPTPDSAVSAPLSLVDQPTADLMGEVNPGSSQIAVPAVATASNATLQQYLIRHTQATSPVNGLQFVYVVSDTVANPQPEPETETTDGDGAVTR